MVDLVVGGHAALLGHVLHFHIWCLELPWTEDVSKQAASEDKAAEGTDDNANEGWHWHAGHLVCATLLHVESRVRGLDIHSRSQSIVEVSVWVVWAVVGAGLTWNVSTLYTVLESVQVALLSLECSNLSSDVSLLDPNLIEVLLLDSLLLDCLPLLLKLQSLLFLLNFGEFTLHKAVVDIAINIGLQLLEQFGLLSQLVLSGSLAGSRGRNVVLGVDVLGLHL